MTGRTSIARALSDIYLNAFADGDVDLRYDVVHLGNRIGTMAVVDGMMHESGKRAKALPFRWTFILRRNPVYAGLTFRSRLKGADSYIGHAMLLGPYRRPRTRW